MYIYKTTNIINGAFYIGKCKHSVQESINYLGSGKVLQLAINKYGKENFKKEILCYCETEAELDEKEKHYIKLNNAIQEGYNITPGGEGGDTISCNPNRDKIVKKISKANKDKIVTKETREKMSKAQKGHKGWKPTKAQKKKQSNKLKSYYSTLTPEERRKKCTVNITDEYRQKISESLINNYKNTTKEERKQKHGHPGNENGRALTWKVTDPDGNEYITDDLAKFSSDRGIGKCVLRGSHYRRAPISRGPYKGWNCSLYFG